MTSAIKATPLPRPPRTWPERLFGRWWRRQSATRQDHFATLGPLVSVMLFLAAIILAFWYLRNEEFERQQESVKRDTEITQQQIRLRLIENQEQLVRIAREIVTRAIDRDQFLAQASTVTREHPEITNLIWINGSRSVKASYSSTSFPAEAAISVDETPASFPAEGADTAPEAAFVAARTYRQPVYSKPFADTFGNSVFQVQVPLIERSAFSGALIAEYSIEGLMRRNVPKDISVRHAAGPGRQWRGVARPRLPHVHRPDQQHPVLDGRRAVGAHGLDAARHLAPHGPAPADAERTGH
jgi:hypothetical protein